MTHRMICTADLSKVYRVVVARRKTDDAGMAEVDMHLLRNEDHSGSTPDASPKIEERE